MRKTDTKSRPQIVNSYKLNLFITDGCYGDQVNPESLSGESAEGESRLADGLYARSVTSKAQSLYIKQRFGKGVHGNITDFFKARITTDSIKIFFITFCTLLSYFLLH